MARVIVGTAGHIDHGKSTLVRALTGTNPDRLPEEQARGITLDLGYAFLDDVAAIIDVPGHEKLIRNMVAGAATVDYALLVIAADDGVMPQTVEHLQILRLLGLQNGVIVLTKCDAVDPDWIALVEMQIHELVDGTFLKDAPIYRVDSLSGRGIPEFRAALVSYLMTLPRRRDQGVFRLPIDRVFSIKGRGTVITGTILSGSVEKDARLDVLPGGFDVRVKRIESHGEEAIRLQAGQRTALNLVGDTDKLARGKTLTVPGTLRQSTILRIAIDPLSTAPEITDKLRVRFLIGTQEAIGRLQMISGKTGGEIYANLLLEEPVVAIWGDRFILRRYSPVTTLGGGTVLELQPPRLRSRDLANESELSRRLDGSDMREAIKALMAWRRPFGFSIGEIAQMFGIPEPEVVRRIAPSESNVEFAQVENYLILHNTIEDIRSRVLHRISELHRKAPDSAGFNRAEILKIDKLRIPEPVANYILDGLLSGGKLTQQGALFQEPSHGITLTPAQKNLADKVFSMIAAGEFTPPIASAIAQTLEYPQADIEKILVLLDKMGKCRRLGLDLFFAVEHFVAAIERIRVALRTSSSLSVSDAARILNSSRKYVVPFLEYLDSQGVTRRDGNVRIAGPK